jgi:threonyl-tRNA synthetase
VIEKRMAELAKKDFPVLREVWPRDKAVEFFKSIGERYKAEIIASIPGDQDVSLYREGDFVDLCRGPHVPSTGKLKVFKLMKVAGAYWRGDSRNEMLQRIYGTAWAKQGRAGRLPAHAGGGREARSSQARPAARPLPPAGRGAGHGVLASQRLGDLAGGRAVHAPLLSASGYLEVRTPQVMDRVLWERSGHWENYREHMFTTKHSEERDYAVKPMNCPGHVQIFNHGLKSYRDLPLRLAEFGSCHRNEPSGALHGIMRVRGFTQDDAHIFCT